MQEIIDKTNNATNAERIILFDGFDNMLFLELIDHIILFNTHLKFNILVLMPAKKRYPYSIVVP